MAIEAGSRSILDADVGMLVNPVNTVGVMGKGLAALFKSRFPSNFEAYSRACRDGEIDIGRVFITWTLPCWLPRSFIANFPTKRHWRDPSKIEYIRDGMRDLVARVEQFGIRSVAIPALGCGLGELDWDEVRPVIVDACRAISDVEVVLFGPGKARGRS